MTDIKNETVLLYKAYPYLPGRIVTLLQTFASNNPAAAAQVTEIRLRAGGALSLSVSDKNVMPDENGNISGKPFICSKTDIDICADLLCGSSFHSHKDEIEEGYISSAKALRAGISTYGTYGGAVWGIDGICIRIPRQITGCSVPLLEKTGICSMLVCSPPGVGKTTLLRDIAYQLCEKYGRRIVVCDTKYELLPDKKPLLADYICGKSKARSIECATRYLSAQAVLCDEIGGSDESTAILSAQSGGVPFIATAHAKDFATLLSRPNLKTLYNAAVFDKYVFLSRAGGRLIFDIQKSPAK